MELNWFPGHMMKAIRELELKLTAIDLIIEVVDARIILSSSNPILSKIVKNKTKLLIINKADLADAKANKIWNEYLIKNNYNFLFVNSKDSKTRTEIINMIMNILKPVLEKYYLKGVKNPQLKIMIVGIPNVGKSTLINMLRMNSVAKTGNFPGLTKGQQLIKISESIFLIDTPGILWPQMNKTDAVYKLCMCNAIKSSLIPIEDITNYALNLLISNYKDYLLNNYPLSAPIIKGKSLLNEIECEDFFQQITTNQNKNVDVNILLARNKFLQNLWNSSLSRLSYELPPIEEAP